MISSILTFPLQLFKQAKLLLNRYNVSHLRRGALPSIRQPDIHHTGLAMDWNCTLTSFREELDVAILESAVQDSLVGSVE